MVKDFLKLAEISKPDWIENSNTFVRRSHRGYFGFGGQYNKETNDRTTTMIDENANQISTADRNMKDGVRVLAKPGFTRD